MKRQGYEAADIAMAIDRASIPIPEGELVQPVFAAPEPTGYEEDYFAM